MYCFDCWDDWVGFRLRVLLFRGLMRKNRQGRINMPSSEGGGLGYTALSSLLTRTTNLARGWFRQAGSGISDLPPIVSIVAPLWGYLIAL